MYDRNAQISRFAPDPLGELLAGMRLRGARYSKFLLSPPFGLSFPAEKLARFHFVAAGEAFLQLATGEIRKLSCGDAVLMPRGDAHSILSGPGAPVQDVARFATVPLCPGVCSVDARSEGVCRTKDALIFTGCMEFELETFHPLVSLMPAVMPVCALLERQPEIRTLLDVMETEMAASRAGSAGILARLAEVVAANLVREWVETGDGRATGWLAALRDQRLGQVLAALHRDPGRDWTVEEMANLMGRSRSNFAERFVAATGMTPVRYLTGIRMHLATHWMQRDRVSIDEVARRLNYNSQAAFSRAFKRYTGHAPGQVRRSAGTS